MEILTILSNRISEICPISGVSVGDINDKSSWRVDYLDATDEQKLAAQNVINNFDTSKISETIEKINKIELTHSVRRLRESILTDDGKMWLQESDNQIAQLRGEL